MRPPVIAIVAVVLALGPSVAAAQGRVVASDGIAAPEVAAEQAILFSTRDDGTVTMVVQPRFTTSPQGASFVVLLATPAPPTYGTSDPALFDLLAADTATRFEPREVQVEDAALGDTCPVEGGCLGGPIGGGCAAGDFGPLELPLDGATPEGPEVITVGPYEVVPITAADTTELANWLEQLDYLYTQEDLDAVAPYLARGDTITAVRVTAQQPGTTRLEVLTLTWAGAEIRVPLALGRPDPGESLHLTLYISAPQRLNVPIIRPVFAARRGGGESLTRTELDIAPGATLDADPVAVRVTGMPEIFPIEFVDVEVRVPLKHCPSEEADESDSGCCGVNRRRLRWDAVLVAGAILLSVRRRRRHRAPSG